VQFIGSITYWKHIFTLCISGSFVDIRPIAYMVMEDEKGMDEKVLAVR
jgi:inorganic pyrophosphatase